MSGSPGYFKGRKRNSRTAPSAGFSPEVIKGDTTSSAYIPVEIPYLPAGNPLTQVTFHNFQNGGKLSHISQLKLKS
jgi:hypothetical protein